MSKFIRAYIQACCILVRSSIPSEYDLGIGDFTKFRHGKKRAASKLSFRGSPIVIIITLSFYLDMNPAQILPGLSCIAWRKSD